jgi:spore germination protein YaaH
MRRPSLIALALALAVPAQATPRRRVFAYLAAGASTASLRWDLLSDLAFSSEPLATDGTLTTTSWNGAGKAMIAAAHAHGVKVELTVQLFNTSGGSEIATFLGNAAAVQKGTQQIVAAVQAAGGDGVDVDFEFVPSANKAAFTSFVAGLAAAMHAAVPGSDVSVAMPGTAYPGYDIAGLGAAADTLMIMSYDFHWATSDPGPVAPLADSTLWKAGSQTASVALFKASVDPGKLVLGMPLYGYDYHATGSTVPTTHVAGTSATAIQWKDCAAMATMYGRKWDAGSSTPYLVYQDTTMAWRQLFYEDPESLGLKIDLADTSGLAGIGLWNLAYADDTFFAVVAQKLGPASSDGGAGSDGGVGDAAAPDDLAAAPAGNGAHGAAPHGGCEVAPRGDAGVGPLALALVAAGLVRARRRRAA